MLVTDREGTQEQPEAGQPPCAGDLPCPFSETLAPPSDPLTKQPEAGVGCWPAHSSALVSARFLSWGPTRLSSVTVKTENPTKQPQEITQKSK